MKTVESVQCRVVRVYGSNSYFGREPRTAPPGNPIVLEDFPEQGDTTTLEFGPIPDWYSKAFTISTSFVYWMAKAFGGNNISTAERYKLIKDTASDLDHSAEWEKQNWYTVICANRTLTVPKEHQKTTPVLPFSAEFFYATADELEDKLSHVLDFLAAEIGRKLGWHRIDNLILKCRVFFQLNGIGLVRVPKWYPVSAELKILTGHVPNIQELFSNVGDLFDAASAQELTSPYHWLVEARSESDHVKRFLWSFLSLETLAWKLCVTCAANLRSQLGHPDCVRSFEFANYILSNDRFNMIEYLNEFTVKAPDDLAAAFAIVALVFGGPQFQEDLVNFKRFNKFRGRFSHGDIKDLTELPSNEIIALATRYLDLLHQRYDSGA